MGIGRPCSVGGFLPGSAGAVATWVGVDNGWSATLCLSALSVRDTHHTCYSSVPDNPLHASECARDVSGGFGSALLPSHL